MTEQQTALITGASSGIGLALSHCFAEDGIDLIMVARNQPRLDKAAEQLRKEHGITITTIATDLSNHDAVTRVHDEVTSQGLKIDYLVNNAGIGDHGPFAHSNNATNQAMINLNITALTQLTHCFMPSMMQGGTGRILNVASLVGYQPGGPQAALYYATKSFVLTFTRGLALELRNTGLSVTALCPGPTDTHFSSHNGLAETRLYRLFNNDPKQVARIGYRAMHRGKIAVVPGFINKLLAFGGELPPRRIALTINRWLLTKPPFNTQPLNAQQNKER